MAWGAPERAQWLARQRKLRSYADDVVTRIERLGARFDVQEYGQLDYPPDHYRLLALRSRDWRDDRPVVLVTGGVHGYETSGVHGALQFLEQRAADYPVNLLAVPCVSPWAYERIHRWNANAVDPNRSFKEGSPAAESAALLRLVAPLRGRFLLHVDLHETTDSDESEFRPALAARDGKPFEPGLDPGWVLSRRRQRESAARIPARDHRCSRQDHAHRAGGRQRTRSSALRSSRRA